MGGPRWLLEIITVLQDFFEKQKYFIPVRFNDVLSF